MFLYICRASSSSVSTPISLSMISPYWFMTRYVGIASCLDGWMKSSLSVNSLFSAPGKSTLPLSVLGTHGVLVASHFSTLADVAAPRHLCNEGMFACTLEPLRRACAPKSFSTRNLREVNRKDIFACYIFRADAWVYHKSGGGEWEARLAACCGTSSLLPQINVSGS
jgi:hypothetical protein